MNIDTLLTIIITVITYQGIEWLIHFFFKNKSVTTTLNTEIIGIRERLDNIKKKIEQLEKISHQQYLPPYPIPRPDNGDDKNKNN